MPSKIGVLSSHVRILIFGQHSAERHAALILSNIDFNEPLQSNRRPAA
jgi:hypothetical protein